MKILSVEKDSIADELGLKAGDNLISIDGRRCVDVLDYEAALASTRLVIEVSAEEEITKYEIEKEEYEDLGLSFSDFTIRQCRNKCIFCFVDQLPRKDSVRKTLKIKDDDYRMSFISGTYITLTNLNESDIERILRLRLSPLYISVHSVDEKLRKYMLGIEKSRPILPLLKRFKEGGIKLHTQIVYCPEVNEDYAATIEALSPLVETLAIVPVGLTKDCNPTLIPVNKTYAERVIDTVEKFQKLNLKRYGERKIYASDEFYIKAERETPDYEAYENFDQIENGIGMIARFKYEFEEALSEAVGKGRDVSIATGVSAYELIKDSAEIINRKFDGKIKVYKIVNKFFGPTVTVTGLTVGGDIAEQLKGKDLGSELVIVRTMLKEFGDCFLDNMTLRQLEERLGVKVNAIAPSGDAFVNALIKETV